MAKLWDGQCQSGEKGDECSKKEGSWETEGTNWLGAAEKCEGKGWERLSGKKPYQLTEGKVNERGGRRENAAKW